MSTSDTLTHPVKRTDVAKVVQQTGLSQAKSRMLVHLACAELDLPAGDLSPRVAGEVETIAMRKARAMQSGGAK
jgi:hypothetical protein